MGERAKAVADLASSLRNLIQLGIWKPDIDLAAVPSQIVSRLCMKPSVLVIIQTFIKCCIRLIVTEVCSYSRLQKYVCDQMLILPPLIPACAQFQARMRGH